MSEKDLEKQPSQGAQIASEKEDEGEVATSSTPGDQTEHTTSGQPFTTETVVIETSSPSDSSQGESSTHHGTVAISYGGRTEQIEGACSKDELLSKFGLGTDSNVQLQTEEGEEVPIAMIGRHKNLSLVVRRSRRRDRNTKSRMLGAGVDLSEGMSLAESRILSRSFEIVSTEREEQASSSSPLREGASSARLPGEPGFPAADDMLAEIDAAWQELKARASQQQSDDTTNKLVSSQSDDPDHMPDRRSLRKSLSLSDLADRVHDIIAQSANASAPGVARGAQPPASEPSPRLRAATVSSARPRRENMVRMPLPLQVLRLRKKRPASERLDSSARGSLLELIRPASPHRGSTASAPSTVEADYKDVETTVLDVSTWNRPGLAFQQFYILRQTTVPADYADTITGHDICQCVISQHGDGASSSLFVANVAAGSAAESAGICVGDMVMSIDGQDSSMLTVEEAQDLLDQAAGEARGLELVYRPLDTRKLDDIMTKIESDAGAVPELMHQSSAFKLASFFGENKDVFDPEKSFLYEVTRTGLLWRKTVLKEMGKKTKKSKKQRAWKQYQTILRGHVLYFYSPSQANVDDPLTHQPEGGRVSIKACLCDIAYEYKKRPHVFRLRTFVGAEYLLQATSKEDMLSWISTIQSHNNPDENELSQHEVIKRAASQRALLSKSSTASSLGLGSRTSSKDKIASSTTGSSRQASSSKRRLRKKGSNASLNTSTASTGPLSQSIEDACMEQNTTAPLLLTKLIAEIERRGLDEEGIYRQSGSNTALITLRQALNTELETVDLSDEDRFPEIHALCGIVKEYIRSLAEPVLTADAYAKFIQAVRRPRADALPVVQHLLLELPPHHLSTLRILVNHLRNVVMHSSSNKMATTNVALIFGPTLVRPKASNNTLAMLSDMKHQNTLVEMLLEHADELFEPFDEQEEAVGDGSGQASSRASTTVAPDAEDDDGHNETYLSSGLDDTFDESESEFEAPTGLDVNRFSGRSLESSPLVSSASAGQALGTGSERAPPKAELRATWMLSEFDRLISSQDSDVTAASPNQTRRQTPESVRPVSVMSASTVVAGPGSDAGQTVDEAEASRQSRGNNAASAHPSGKSLPLRPSCQLALLRGPPPTVVLPGKDEQPALILQEEDLTAESSTDADDPFDAPSSAVSNDYIEVTGLRRASTVFGSGHLDEVEQDATDFSAPTDAEDDVAEATKRLPRPPPYPGAQTSRQSSAISLQSQLERQGSRESSVSASSQQQQDKRGSRLSHLLDKVSII